MISGKWEIRKSHDKIAKALARFKDRNIKVIIACENPFSSPEENNAWLNMFSALGDKCLVARRCALHEDFAQLYNQVDCLISPSRAEGWNLPVLEAMACGKHVITTNYSAHTQFCIKDNSRLIEIDNVEPAFDGKFFNGTGGNWASFEDSQFEQLCNHIDSVILEKESGSLNINNNGIKTAEIFSWINTSNKIMEAVNCLV
jgi:glycosyltransferase involved in cell wall biosynthesis